MNFCFLRSFATTACILSIAGCSVNMGQSRNAYFQDQKNQARAFTTESQFRPFLTKFDRQCDKFKETDRRAGLYLGALNPDKPDPVVNEKVCKRVYDEIVQIAANKGLSVDPVAESNRRFLVGAGILAAAVAVGMAGSGSNSRNDCRDSRPVRLPDGTLGPANPDCW